MELNEYQKKALETDLNPNTREGLMISLLGVAGEAGELLSIYKKHLRDGDSYTAFNKAVVEELGDVLWYLTNIASKFGISLEDIANSNLSKTRKRWVGEPKELQGLISFDEQLPLSQQWPSKLDFSIREKSGGPFAAVVTYHNEIPVGDPLTDNSYTDDGYRYHDVFHMSYLAVLGWSPVLRKNLSRKRKSNQKIDEVEDGGRAAVIEEGIAALIYGVARDHNWFEKINHVDGDLLKTIKKMTAHLEVNDRTEKQWEQAILQGFKVWRKFQHFKEGTVIIDMDKSTLSFEPFGNDKS
ncbi:nucleoside triphosphate pyrophosphohydrolase family protein [Mucilaginibacter sp. SP1R1]|uniref:nucleoside triphosphate pyrophosphohydrolase family protein n=1 Tax=Mucilaginibacter sp. SP1R1 TaxID=2723091 RepID=UPI00160D545F|nr:nucleoside triphosphate pyrophosphohydrolase family protein [Mucilaginibacter sp. SP1R1]MBB6149600.1 NTP pyrophosphatase (non-canonical NTP hydrolase) [Mucilaginibacter sp. SP1R1]